MKIKKVILSFLLLVLVIAGFNHVKVNAQTFVPAKFIYMQNADDDASDEISKKYGFTIPEEYNIGRIVAYSLLQRFDNKVVEDKELNEYVNLVGQSIAKASSKRPKIIYKFGIIDTEEINAFACPGGYIFVTTGLLKLLPDENSLAGVLAHEIGHVEHGDGLRDIRNHRADKYADVKVEKIANNAELFQDMAYYIPGAGRYVSADYWTGRAASAVTSKIPGGYGTGVGRWAARSATKSAMDLAVDALKEGAKSLGKKAIQSWYYDPLEPSVEFDADLYSVRALSNVGYDPESLAEFLQVMQYIQDASPGASEAQNMFTYRHPKPEERIEKIENEIQKPDIFIKNPNAKKVPLFKERYKGKIMTLKN